MSREITGKKLGRLKKLTLRQNNFCNLQNGANHVFKIVLQMLLCKVQGQLSFV